MLSPADSIATRQSLLARMKNWEDKTSWQDFFNTYWKLIYGVAIKSGLTSSEAEEVVQESVISVAKSIGGFKNDRAFGSFKSWLMLIARRRIADQFRKRPPAPASSSPHHDDSPRTATIERLPDPGTLELDSVWDEQWEHHLLDLAMRNVKDQTSPRQFMLFHQQVVKELPAAEVAAKFDVSLAQVYMAKYRVGGLLKKELRKLRRKMS
jgi:RNA polymerase sigma-70 factor (ECF subfamily)